MNEIENTPQSNRQLKTITIDHSIEKLYARINHVYKIRQEERIAYQRREEQIRREIENISHDLRTPLTSIIGYVDLIKDIDTSQSEKIEYLDIIGKRSRVLQGFIQDFYELSRIEGDDYPFLYESVEIQSMVKEVIVAYYQQLKKENIKVDIQLDDKPSYIIVDKIQFIRIINNLVQNALKYAMKSFVIKQYKIDGECIIELSNDKNHMKEEELAFIFDRFYTGDTTRNTQSTGLGLSIAKVLTEKMKGSITAQLDGEMFVITLRWKSS